MTERPQFLIVVFDGLRLDMVSAERMPNLHRFMKEGVSFPHSRSVFPASTRTNAAALATGATPRRNGIMHNMYYDPNVFRDRMFRPNSATDIAAGMAAYSGALLDTPGLADVVTSAGLKVATLFGGSCGTARLTDPRAPERGAINLGMIGWENACPAPFVAELAREFGPLPQSGRPDVEVSRVLTDMVVGAVLPRQRPDITIVWFTDPDQTHHYLGVARPEMATALASVDRQFGRLLAWRSQAGLDERMQVIAMSDHGHLNTKERIDVNGAAGQAGLVIGDHLGNEIDYAGYTSYCGAIKVRDRDPARMTAMVEWLARQPWCGMIFTAGGNGTEGGVAGTIDHAAVLIDHPRAPDIYFIMRNDDAVYGDGVVGSCYYNGRYPAGGGTHGGLHRKELQTVLAAQGSHFRKEWVSPFPAGIIDVAPTVLHLLGLAKPTRADGRVLAEALAAHTGSLPQPEKGALSVRHAGGLQRLEYSRVGTTTYLDAGWVE
ncbi:MAG: alkaline phosphatase family protein [Hyphomicrobiaceae bacterium]